MAPTELKGYSCHHCRRLVFTPTRKRTAEEAVSSDTQNYKKDAHGIYFDFRVSDIILAAASGCNLCNWILDCEYTHRSDIVSQFTKDRYTDFRVILALQDVAMGVEEYLSPREPGKVLRKEENYLSGELDNYVLYAFTYQESGNEFDIFDVEFFGWCDPETRKVIYRTMASAFMLVRISTRLIEEDPACDENFSKVSSWLNKCLSSHPDCAAMSSTFMPTQIIEIADHGKGWRLRLRHSAEADTAPYIALIYCWGGDQESKCSSDLIGRWLAAIPYEILPKTIQDAVTVCRRLGIRYLLVDSLCIIQDDTDDMALEIACMRQVYSNAVLTIAAARAINVHEGFLGARVATDHSDEVFELPYRCVSGELGTITLFRTDIKKEPIDERAWTLQERLLSPRTVEYGTRQIRWICQKTKYQEGYTDGWRRQAEYHSGRKNALDHDIFHHKFKKFQALALDLNDEDYKSAVKHWYRLVETYTHRKLTFHTDRILAISGIAELYGRIFGDEYLAGLWRSTLSEGLFWKASLHGKNVPRPQEYQGPSWAWTAINGSLDFHSSFDSNEKQGLEILECSTILVDAQAPYGAIRKDTGRLVVKGRLLPAFHSTIEATSLIEGSKDALTFPMINGSGGFGQCSIFRVTMGSGSGIVKALCCVAWRGQFSRGWGYLIIILAGKVRRTVQNPESFDEWSERVDLEHNWFKYCTPRIVEII